MNEGPLTLSRRLKADGQVSTMLVMDCMIATSGHLLHVVHFAGHCRTLMYELDRRIDDAVFIAALYEDAGWPIPVKPRPEWALDHLDLVIHDKVHPATFVVACGWN